MSQKKALIVNLAASHVSVSSFREEAGRLFMDQFFAEDLAPGLGDDDWLNAAVAAACSKVGGEAGDAVAGLIAALGLPGTLRDVGVRADQLDIIAEGSMHDRMVHTNPRKIDGPAVVRQLLDAAW